jgi:CheY-like chemotaxis protein
MQLEPRAAARGLALAVVPNRAVVRSDPVLLERILLNLVNNAIRYTRAGRVLVGCRRRNGLLRIEVRDTGIGIAPDKQQMIFEEFSRVADTDQAGEKSTGLGLAIVNRLARLLNHPVAVQSVPGRGSMFVITVPWVAAQAATADAVQAAPSVASLLGTRVLVIDDDADVRTAMQTTLESWGCEVATAASGNEALARFTESGAHPPHVVISDYRLSGTETGIQALGQLRALSPQGWFGVVVTGDIAPEVAEAARRYDYPVMRKPVPPARLRALLAHYAQLRRSAQHDDGQSGSG